MKNPTTEDLKKFMDVFDELCKFEAQTRHNRGYGCFKDSDLPIQEVVKVCSWLRERTVREEKDVITDLIKKYEKKAHSLKIEAISAQNQNDYITMSTCNEEAEIYESIISDLRNLSGYSKK
jgi:hypothetical protein